MHMALSKRTTKAKTKKAPAKARTKTSDIFREFLEHNEAKSAEFVSSEQTLWRDQYKVKYPAEIVAMKCMDGRLNMSIMTQTPVGIIQPYRNLGGVFDIGSHFGEVLGDRINRATKVNGNDVLVLVTYHWSKGTKECGCKGFGYDVDAACAYVSESLLDLEDVFGKDHHVIYPVKVGIETDEDTLVFHGAGGKKLDMSEMASDSRDILRAALAELYPDMNENMMKSLVKLCVGNIRHIAEIRKTKRSPIDLDHKENILAVGRGFDWFHLPNRMLIVGPYSLDLKKPIVTAGKIILSNIKEGRIPKKDGFLLVTSTPYRNEAGFERQRVVKKSQSLMEFALAALEEEVHQVFALGIRSPGRGLCAPRG